jgi:hypothetical protein
MPKRALIVLAVVALALAIPACNNNTNPTTTPAPSVSFTPNPKITAATISVTIQASPAPWIPVEESTPASTSSPRPGTPFLRQKTGIHGNTTFTGLKPTQIYCWVAILGPHATSSTCAGWEVWQLKTVTLGN